MSSRSGSQIASEPLPTMQTPSSASGRSARRSPPRPCSTSSTHGRLSLDDRAGEIVARRSPVRPRTRRVEQLLLHTSGLTGSHGSDHEPLDRDAAVARSVASSSPSSRAPTSSYSNAGYTLLALDRRGGVRHDLPRLPGLARSCRSPTARVAGGFWDGEPAAPGPRAIGYLDDGPTDEMGGFDGPHWALRRQRRPGDDDAGRWQPGRSALFTGRGRVARRRWPSSAEPGFDLDDGTSETPGWVAYDESIFGEPFLATAGGGGDVGHNAVVVWVPDGERVIAITSNGPDVTAEELAAGDRAGADGGRSAAAPRRARRRHRSGGSWRRSPETYELDSGGARST